LDLLIISLVKPFTIVGGRQWFNLEDRHLLGLQPFATNQDLFWQLGYMVYLTSERQNNLGTLSALEKCIFLTIISYAEVAIFILILFLKQCPKLQRAVVTASVLQRNNPVNRDEERWRGVMKSIG
jgi:hypothetical protein